MMIDDGVAEVDEWKILQLGERRIDRRFAGANALEKRTDSIRFHGRNVARARARIRSNGPPRSRAEGEPC